MKAAHTTIQFDLPASDLAIIRKAADAAGMTVGQYFRFVMSTKLGTSRPDPDDLVVTIAGCDRNLDGFSIVPMAGESPSSLAERQASWDKLVAVMGASTC